MRRFRPTGLMGDHDFLKLWSAQTVSVFGSQISQLAIPLLAIVLLGAQPLEVGLLTALGYLPFLLVGLPAGVWVDRRRRRPILVAADIGRAALLATIPIAHLLGALTMLHLYIVTFAAGILTVFFDVSYQSYLPSLVRKEQLMEGNSRLEVSRSASEVAGPGLAGVLVQLLTGPIAIALDALSFLVSGLFLVVIGRREDPPSVEQSGSMLAEIREGLAFVLGDPILRRIAASSALANLFSSVAGSVILIFAVRDLGLTPVVIGVVIAVGNVGALVGALVTSRIQRALGVGPTIIAAGIVFAGGYLLMPLATVVAPILFATLALFGATLGAMVYSITQLTLRQSMAPARIAGRMNATMRTISWGALPIGMIAGGAIGQFLGLVPAIWIGAFGLLLAIAPILFGPVRHVRSFPSPIAPVEPHDVERGAAAAAGVLTSWKSG